MRKEIVEDNSISQLIPVEGNVTMDSREIAELLEVRHNVVTRSIETELPKIGSTLEVYTYIHPQNNQTYKYYRLNFQETMVILTGFDVRIRNKVIERWIELEKAKSLPPPPPALTGTALLAAAVLEAQVVIADYQNKLAQKDEQLAIAATKVESFDQLMDSSTTSKWELVAKVLNFQIDKKLIGEKTLCRILREIGVLDQSNIPYQKYRKPEWFKIIPSVYTAQNGNTYHSYKTEVYPKGIDYILKLLKKHYPEPIIEEPLPVRPPRKLPDLLDVMSNKGA